MPNPDWDFPWPILRQGWAEDWDSRDECAAILRSWHEHDRRVVGNFQDFLTARRLMEGHIACSSAIASLRSAVADPLRVEQWRRDHEKPAASCRRSWPGPWGTNADWGAGSSGWPGIRDPRWDGITQVSKTPGKKKRRKERTRQHREEEERQRQHNTAREEASCLQDALYAQYLMGDPIDCGREDMDVGCWN
ncbi:hypothetical protein B0H13DRAFT_2329070 [Mycena leptocephala]|nr:hypothetical protein B0H13DRAFT_2329070 [Mycena leptocephala]